MAEQVIDPRDRAGGMAMKLLPPAPRRRRSRACVRGSRLPLTPPHSARWRIKWR